VLTRDTESTAAPVLTRDTESTTAPVLTRDTESTGPQKKEVKKGSTGAVTKGQNLLPPGNKKEKE